MTRSRGPGDRAGDGKLSTQESRSAAQAFAADGPASTPTRRARTPDADVIVATAARLFHQFGYQNTTMQAIADELGISKPTLYVHGKSKSFLLGQIFQRVLQHVDQLIDGSLSEPDAIEGIVALIRGQIKLSISYRDYYGVIYGDQQELPADLDRAYRTWSRGFVDRVQALISRGQKQGTVRADYTPIVVAHTIVGITGWSARWLRPHRGITVDAVIQETTALILGGIRVVP